MRRVVGNSMLPMYRQDQVVLVLRRRRVAVGDAVVIVHNGLEKIKRVCDMRRGRIYVVGDNPGESTDSRDFGWLDISAVQGVVVWPRRPVRVQPI